MCIDWNVLKEEYVKYLIVANRSKETVRTHMYYIDRFSKIFINPLNVSTKDVYDFLCVENWSGETKKSARSSIRGFYKFLMLFDYIKSNPTIDLPVVKIGEHLPKPVPEDVFIRALEIAPYRTRVMILLAGYLGLRVSELCKVSSNDWDGFGLTVLGKGNKMRYIPVVHEEIKTILNNTTGFLFPSCNGEHLSSHYCSKLIKRCLPKGYSAHCLRHRMATISYKNSRDILAVGKVLGHSRPETTQRYVKLCDDDLVKAVQSAIVS